MKNIIPYLLTGFAIVLVLIWMHYLYGRIEHSVKAEDSRSQTTQTHEAFQDSMLVQINKNILKLQGQMGE